MYNLDSSTVSAIIGFCTLIIAFLYYKWMASRANELEAREECHEWMMMARRFSDECSTCEAKEHMDKHILVPDDEIMKCDRCHTVMATVVVQTEDGKLQKICKTCVTDKDKVIPQFSC